MEMKVIGAGSKALQGGRSKRGKNSHLNVARSRPVWRVGFNPANYRLRLFSGPKRICVRWAMAKAVRAAIADILARPGGTSRSDAEREVEDGGAEGRIKIDAFD
jgi:hypothetical protein